MSSCFLTYVAIVVVNMIRDVVNGTRFLCVGSPLHPVKERCSDNISNVLADGVEYECFHPYTGEI